MPTLVILAAGMGSRFGGMKQFSSFGPYDHLIIDYTIYDAIKAGFGKVVFVIRKETESDLTTAVLERWNDKIDIAVVYQEIDSLPDKYPVLEGRSKPWGTAHAIWMAETEVNQPFAIANADDFYGRQAIRQCCEQLNNMKAEEDQAFIIGYHLGNTLSPNGSVSRGLCKISSSGHLKDIEELKEIELKNDKIVAHHKDKIRILDSDDLVSMNLMGFTPQVFKTVEEGFDRFYKRLPKKSEAEFYLADVLKELIKKGIEIPVIPTESQWFGVTYSKDSSWVNRQLSILHKSGVYPDEF